MIYVFIPSILLHTWRSLYRKLFRRLWVTFVDNFVLRMFDFGGRWTMNLKNRGGIERMRGGQCRKAVAVVWQWVPTFKEAVPPPGGPLLT